MYDVQVVNALKKIWPLSGFASSKHLVAFIRLNAELLFRHPEIRDSIAEKTKHLLLRISPATVDRLLKALGKGEFIYTLTAVEIATGWTELRALRNKAAVWTTAALKDIVEKIPIPVVAIYSDNGSEFINAHVQKFCKLKGINFSRSRP